RRRCRPPPRRARACSAGCRRMRKNWSASAASTRRQAATLPRFLPAARQKFRAAILPPACGAWRGFPPRPAPPPRLGPSARGRRRARRAGALGGLARRGGGGVRVGEGEAGGGKRKGGRAQRSFYPPPRWGGGGGGGPCIKIREIRFTCVNSPPPQPSPASGRG